MVIWLAFGSKLGDFTDRAASTAASRQAHDPSAAIQIENGRIRRPGNRLVTPNLPAPRDDHHPIEIINGKIRGGAASKGRTLGEAHAVIEITNGKIRSTSEAAAK